MDPLASLGAFPLVCPACLAREGRERRLDLAAAGGACGGCGRAARRTAGGAPVLLPDDAPGSGYYEAPATSEEYLRFHYPETDELSALLGPTVSLPPPAERYPLGVRALWDPAPEGLAADLGCACGRMTFELARDHAAAIGIDRSARLVDDACAVAARGRVRYRAQDEGRVGRNVDIPFDTPGRAAFLVGDALAPPLAAGSCATVLALNLLCRVPDPARCLDAAARLVRPEGLLIVSSPYGWLETFTPPDRWLGGTGAPGAPLGGAEGIRAHLGGRFVLEREERLVFYIPWHDRAGHISRSHVQRFRRRDRSG